MARYAVTTADAQAVIRMTIGGQSATKFYDDEKIFDITLRFEKKYRDSKKKIEDILIPTINGKKVPLKEIATVEYKTVPIFIYREGNSRYIAVGFSIEGRDLESTIEETKKKVAAEVKLPKEYVIKWAGEFESKERASKQLAMIVPVILVLILWVLYLNFGNSKTGTE